MQLQLSLSVIGHRVSMPINYQYPLSAVIYGILNRADAAYASFLHNTGYKATGSLKTFKLFTFSDIRVPFKIEGDRLVLQSNEAALVVSFHLPQAAENFIKGLFMHQEIEIADKKSKVVFRIQQVALLPLRTSEKEVQELLMQPISPIVVGSKNEMGNYTFLSPVEPAFLALLQYNWKEKYTTVYGALEAEHAFKELELAIVMYANPPKSRLITIKAYTPAETKIRGFVNFKLKVTAGKKAMELLLNGGAGVYNSLGMGCLEVLD